MATAVLTVQNITTSGLTPTFTAPTATDGFEFAGNTGNHFIRIKNTDASTRTATPTVSGKTKSGLAGTAVVVTVPANTGDILIGPFDPADYGTTVTVAISATAGITAAAIKL